MNTDTTDDLVEQLRAAAEGFSPTRAAVELLIGHETWLNRADFTDRCLNVTESISEPGRMLAIIDWEEAGRLLDQQELPAPGSATGVLAIAVSLAEGRPVDLRDAVVGLDPTNTSLVADAVITAAQAEQRVSVELRPRTLPAWLQNAEEGADGTR